MVPSCPQSLQSHSGMTVFSAKWVAFSRTIYAYETENGAKNVFIPVGTRRERKGLPFGSPTVSSLSIQGKAVRPLLHPKNSNCKTAVKAKRKVLTQRPLCPRVKSPWVSQHVGLASCLFGRLLRDLAPVTCRTPQLSPGSPTSDPWLTPVLKECSETVEKEETPGV